MSILLLFSNILMALYRPLGYERVYVPHYKVADTPFHTRGGRYIELLEIDYVWNLW